MPSVAYLREHHPTFRFTSSTWELNSDTLVLTFQYHIEPNLSFTHTVSFTRLDLERVATLPPELLDSLSFSVGMVTALSYWKTTASPNFVVQAGALSPEQIAWWHTLLIEGMGESFFVNDIDCTQDSFVTITAPGPATTTKLNLEPTDAPHSAPTTSPNPPERGTTTLNLTKPFVVPLGGGKDSVVSLELLKEFMHQTAGTEASSETSANSGATPDATTSSSTNPATNTPHSPGVLLFQAPTAAQEIAKISQTPETIRIQRSFDPLLLELNAQGYLNGHTPFSAMLAFVSIYASVLYGYQSVVLSNEHSANEGNVVFHGKEINHQYSKSFAFEQSFQQYCQTFLFAQYAPEDQPRYFSLLRPLFELQISALLAPLEKYHQSFRSCNRGQTTNSWCGNCPKCLFAYLITLPHLPWGKSQEVFGKDLLADMALLETAKELLGIGEKKPLDCVGTYEESMIASFVSVQRYKQHTTPLPPLLAWIATTVLPSQANLPERAHAILHHFEPLHAIPKPLERFLKKKLYNPLETLAGKQFVIFGFGREGKSLLDFLHSTFPTQEILVADDNHNPVVGTRVAVDSDPTRVAGTQAIIAGTDTNSHTFSPNILSPDQITATPTTVIFKSPGIPNTHPKIIEWQTAGAELHSATQLFFELLTTLATPPLVIGVTGTKGKSTTTAMIAHVLQTAGKQVLLGGNIGIPALELWKELENAPANLIVVLELSAHQLATLTFSPTIAVIQDITPEHLDYYPDFARYLEAKAQIITHQSPDDFVVYNLSLETPTQLANRSHAQHLPFSAQPLPNSICYEVDGAITYQNDTVIETTDLPLTGAHNQLNVMPAVIIAKQLGIPTTTIATGLKTFTPLPHRLQLVRTVAGVAYYNDSLATTPEATLAALESFADHPVVLIAGGTDRNLDFSALVAYLATHQIVGLVLFPPTGETIAHQLAQKNSSIPWRVVASMPEAVATAREFATTGLASGGEATTPTAPSTSNPPPESLSRTTPVVLLSPGSASFGLFTDYADRGNQFMKEVLRI